ncbi:MAG: hypothetical protein ACRCT8_04385 [Lacipirellulaceae bacterium]
MESETDQLRTIRSQTFERLRTVRSELKPTYWIDGQRVHWETYAESLQRTIDWCDQKIADLEPFEVSSRGGAP